MFNKFELLSVMAKKHMAVKDLAKAIGISVYTLYSRIRGDVQFSLAEITAIVEVLGLTDKQIIAIFFAK